MRIIMSVPMDSSNQKAETQNHHPDFPLPTGSVLIPLGMHPAFEGNQSSK
jgi:hypothetical protein